jgi:hypothetical protein
VPHSGYPLLPILRSLLRERTARSVVTADRNALLQQQRRALIADLERHFSPAQPVPEEDWGRRTGLSGLQGDAMPRIHHDRIKRVANVVGAA